MNVTAVSDVVTEYVPVQSTPLNDDAGVLHVATPFASDVRTFPLHAPFGIFNPDVVVNE